LRALVPKATQSIAKYALGNRHFCNFTSNWLGFSLEVGITDFVVFLIAQDSINESYL